MLISVPFLTPNVRDSLHRAQEQPEPILPGCTESLASPQPNSFGEKIALISARAHCVSHPTSPARRIR
jgi:hypothetical protein